MNTQDPTISPAPGMLKALFDLAKQDRAAQSSPPCTSEAVALDAHRFTTVFEPVAGTTVNDVWNALQEGTA